MQGNTAGGDNSSLFSNALQQAHNLFNPKRVSYTVAGAFVFVGAAAAMNASSAVNTPRTPEYHMQSASAVPGADNDAVSQPSQANASNGHAAVSASGTGVNHINLNVNGQDIPVPANTITQQTVTSADGQQTSVSTSSNTDQGDASNVNVTTFSLNVSSSSENSGGPSSP